MFDDSGTNIVETFLVDRGEAQIARSYSNTPILNGEMGT